MGVKNVFFFTSADDAFQTKHITANGMTVKSGSDHDLFKVLYYYSIFCLKGVRKMTKILIKGAWMLGHNLSQHNTNMKKECQAVNGNI
jgi:hypothetical protein